jgi:phage-related protein
MGNGRKHLVWLGNSKKKLRNFPSDVKQIMGHALDVAQCGGKHPDAKPLKGFSGAGVLEIVEDSDGDAYRTAYTVKFEHAVYVLHAFQKKSAKGIETPKPDKDLIKSRLKAAKQHHDTQKWE